eukprot:c13768_g1_i1 orf=128-1489(+)
MEHSDEFFPFSTGQRVESKSNIKGFRGAWFRSEIKYVQVRRGEIWCAMHYTDFPDEKMNFTKAYQQDPSGKKKRVLMVRPSFPLICMGVDDSVISAATGSVVVVNGGWWAGDLVDWFTDGCFWAAKITAVLSKDLVQVELPSAPIGEGGSYEAAVKDIRPSLDWSAEQLWTVPSVKSRPHNPKALALDEPSSSLTNPVKDLEIPDKEHIFIAKQEPARTAFGQGFDSTFFGHEEAQMKRKRTVLGDTFGTGRYSNFTNSFSMHSKRLDKGQLKSSSTDLAGKQDVEASPCPNQGQANQLPNVKTDGCKESVPQINAVEIDGKLISEQRMLGTGGASTIVNDNGEAMFFEEFITSLGDGKCLHVNDERIGSSIVALEELVSRVAWLKGVMQLGLKGWCHERKKKRWVFCDREVPPMGKSEQDVELMQNSGSSLGNLSRQTQAGLSCSFTFQKSE